MMCDQYCLDLLFSISRQRCLNHVSWDTISRDALNHLNLQSIKLAQINPPVTENTVAFHQNLISRTQRIGYGCFPPT